MFGIIKKAAVLLLIYWLGTQFLTACLYGVCLAIVHADVSWVLGGAVALAAVILLVQMRPCAEEEK